MKTLQDLENVENKMAIFRDFELLKQYVRTENDLSNAMTLYLDDNQKLEVMRQDYFKNLAQYTKMKIVMTIRDKQIILQILQNESLVEAIFDQYNLVKFLQSADDECKMYALNKTQILEKLNISRWDKKRIIASMSNECRTGVLQNIEFVTQLGLESFDIAELIISLENDEIKYKLSEDYKLDQYNKSQIIKSFAAENKKTIILEDKHGLPNRHIVDIISSLGVDETIDFINNHQIFLQGKNIKPYQIVKRMPTEQQLELVEKIPGMQISEGEKRRIFASLENETKQNVDLHTIDENYRELIGMELSEEFRTKGFIIPKLDEDVSKYKDLDELLTINALQMTQSDKQRQGLLNLCRICPNIDIGDDLILGTSTAEEYIEGETWISSVLEGIKPEWTDVQKLAHIDTAIGKKISYTPNFGTEAEQSEDARALWKIITSGYGVCNGIAQVEQYLLSRVGIESELISGQHHSFVKVKNIEVPTKNGVVQGDTLVDPTWNLTASRFGAMPQHFCKSYEELRKVDIDDNGKDHECHKNEELQQTETINMDTESLREVYKSIGIADKDGQFPIGKLMIRVREIDETSNDMQSNINRKFALLREWCPEFASCQNSTISVIQAVLFEANDKFDFKKCIASRVYDRADSERQAVLYIYIKLENQEKMFYYADKQSGKFIPLSQEQFEAKFECYDSDLEKATDNKRPWENGEKNQENKENSSGQVSAKEGR